MHDCPCCGEATYTGEAPTLCDECYDVDCEMRPDSVGDWGYWNCQRESWIYA